MDITRIKKYLFSNNKTEGLGVGKQYPQRLRTQFIVRILLEMFSVCYLSPMHALTQITQGIFSFSAASEEQLDNLLELSAEKSFLFALYRNEVFLKETVKIVLPIIEKVKDFSILFV